MTEQMLTHFCLTNKCSFYQPKVNEECTVLLPDYAAKSFNNIKTDSKQVYKKHDVLYPIDPRWSRKFTEMINEYLKPYAQQYNIKLTSHSFRINFITDLLTSKVPTHITQELIGHTDIGSIRYQRYTTTNQEKLKHLNRPYLLRRLEEAR